MIEILKSFFKYILLLIFMFFLIFGIIFIFHLLPFFKIHGNQILLNDILKSIIMPSFYHSLINSFIISIFLYGIFILNYQSKFRIISFFIPLIITSSCIFCVMFYLKPKEENINFLKINNAKIYFLEKSFFNYQQKLPEEIEKIDFENNILLKITESKDKKILIKNYKFDFKTDKYKLIQNPGKTDKESILFIFYKIGLFNEIKFYFSQVNDEFIKNVIIVENDKVNFFERLDVSFIEDNIYLTNPVTKVKYEFNRYELNNYENEQSIFTQIFFKNFTVITYKFLYYKDIIKNVLFYFSIVFLILSFCFMIIIKNYPLISMIIKFAILILFYGFFPYIFDIYNKYFNLIVPGKIVSFKDWIFISIIIFIGVILQLVRFIFFKSNTWEKD